eukprot:gene27966-33835_t
MKRVTGHAHAGHYSGTPFDHIVLAHDERHLRRKVLTLQQGEQILIDLPDPIAFTHGDVLVLDDGRMAEIIAAEEVLYEVTPRDRQHLSELAWHLGNRHLPAQLEEDRIVILRDHVIKAMLEAAMVTITTIMRIMITGITIIPMTDFTANTALLRLMTWLSPAFPVGAFSYSHGIERAIHDGLIRDKDTLHAWLIDLLLHGSVWNDAVLFAAGWHDARE